jgi:hypothetical protein
LRGIYLVATGNEVHLPQPADAAETVEKLLDGLAVGTPQEYERIPPIWESAIAAGQRNEAGELQRLLIVSLPEIHETAKHWQVVVIGGGIINGLTKEGLWPRHRILELLAGNRSLVERWERLALLSAAMADDEAVPEGTRYDALRILGALPFESSGRQLIKYLASSSADLQMGAVSGLGDIEDDRATAALLKHFGDLAPGNRELAFTAMLRTAERTVAFLDALESAAISRDLLTDEQKRRLQSLNSERLRERSKAALGVD